MNLKSCFFENRTVITNISGVVLLKGLSLVLSFIMMPIYLAYFNNDSFLGIWYTILSILTWILTFDFGIGNGLRNKLAKAITCGDEKTAKSLISSAYIILGIISLIFTALLAIVIPFVNWQVVLHTTIDNRVLITVIMIITLGIILQFFLKLITSILYALKKNAFANSLGVITNVIILLYLKFIPGINGDNERIIILAIVHSVATILPLIVATIYIFATKLEKYKPSLKTYSKQNSKDVLSVGVLFFVIQLSLLMINATNSLLVNNLYSSSDVVEYNIYYKLFYTAPMLFTLFTQPLWSEISVKYAQNNIGAVRRIYRILLYLVGIIFAGCVLVLICLPMVYKIWLGDNSISADRTIGFVFLIWILIEMLVMALTCVANGITRLKCQTIWTIVAAVIKIPITVLVSKVGIPWYGVIIVNGTVLVPLLVAQFVDLKKNLQT